MPLLSWSGEPWGYSSPTRKAGARVLSGKGSMLGATCGSLQPSTMVALFQWGCGRGIDPYLELLLWNFRCREGFLLLTLPAWKCRCTCSMNLPWYLIIISIINLSQSFHFFYNNILSSIKLTQYFWRCYL